MQMSPRLLSMATVLALLMFAGCSKSPVGTYINQKNATYYLELRSDRTFFLNDFAGKFNGKYRIEGHTITIEVAGQDVSRVTLDGSTLTDKDGDKWVRKSR